MKTLAIFSPNQNAYSETFIQAHKKLPFNIKYYYGGALPTSLESENDILKTSFSERIKRRLLKRFSFAEKKLLFSLRREKVNCILAEYGPVACESLRVIKYLQIPLIIHFHGYDATEKETLKYYGEKYKEAFEYAAKIVVVSKKMHQDLLNLGCPSKKLFINYYGPADSFFSISPNHNNKQFISVGRFVDKKAPYLTIAAFKKVVELFPDAQLVMVGGGELLNICKTLVRGWRLNNNVKFTGIINADAIKVLFRTSIAYVQHSIVAPNGDSEGTPVAVLEAQAAALPVISTYHAGIPDVVINNETGLLTNEFDVDEMANNMLRIINEKGLAKKLGEAGRKRIVENFTMAMHLKIIEDLVNAAGKTSPD